MQFWDWPLPVLTLRLLVAMLAAHEIGLWFGGKRKKASPDSAGDESFIVSGVLGLLALLMAFSFSWSLARLEERRNLMLAEASAIGNLAILSEATAPAEGAAIRAALQPYAAARLTTVRLADGPARATAALQADQLRLSLLQAVTRAVRLEVGRPASVALAQAYDVVEDTAVRREAMTQAHLPDRMLRLLAIYCVIAAAMLGHAVARGPEKRRLASITFYALLSFAFDTMLDLDRPRSGSITVSQEPFEAAVQSLSRPAAPAAP